MRYQPTAQHGDPWLRATLTAYGLKDSRITPLSLRVHATFRVDAAGGARYVLRIYRSGSYSEAAIRSELVWLSALRSEECLRVPEPVPTTDGSWVSRVAPGDGSEPRHAVLLGWLPGRIPETVPEAASYRRFGEFMGRLHRHGSHFRAPPGFDRPHYDLDRILGAPGAVIPPGIDSTLVSAEQRRMLDEAAAILRPAIAELGRGPEVFGLIHGDLQLSNQLLHEGEVGAIDFVDCGWGYHLYDVAGALLPSWEGPGSEERKEAFLRGYRRIRPLSRAHEALLGTFAIARGLSVLRWSLANWSDPGVREYAETIVPHVKAQIERFLVRRRGSAPAAPGGGTIRELLAELRGRGVRLWEEDGHLRYKAPRGALGPQLRARLRAHKAEVVRALRSSTTAPAPPILPVPRQATVPTSFAQQRMWILDQIDPGSAAYHIAQAVRLRGELQVAVLEGSLREIVRRHESLRTTFKPSGGRPVQVIAPPPRLTVPMVDLRRLTRAGREAAARRLAAAEARRPFDLGRGPLVRFGLLQLEATEHWLLLTFHHIISDGWSNAILIRELTTLYRAYAAGRGSPLAELPIQYPDFADWQRRWLAGPVLEAQLTYWKEELASIPGHLELPTDRPRPQLQSSRGSEVPLPFSPAFAEALEAFGRRRNVTLFMTLLAALAAVLHRHTGQRDVVVGSPIANRNRTEIEGLIGFFVNTLVLRIRVDGDAAFGELLDRVRAVTLGAYAHQDLPFEMLVDALQPERNPSYTPIFQVMFVLQNAPSPAIELPGLNLELIDPPRTAAEFDLSLTVRQRPGGLEGLMIYNTDLYDATRIRRMMKQLGQLLTGAVADPAAAVAALPLLSAAERQQLLMEWNDAGDPRPPVAAVHHLFAAEVARTPAAVAVVDQRRQLSYRALDARANRLAHFLLGQGVAREELVAICLERSVELLIAVLAVLKAGGAYVTLDPTYPSRRLSFMLEDAAAPVLLTRRNVATAFDGCRARILCLDEDAERIGRQPDSDPDCEIVAGQAAYVVYTSGSAGKPKGVMVSHGSLIRSYLAWEQEYRLRSLSVHLQMASPSFDVFSGDWVRALCSGARLVLCPWDTLLDPERLYELMRNARVDCAEFVPAVVRLLLAHLEKSDKSLAFMGLLAVGSDLWYAPELTRLKALCGPQTRLVNSYGVAEAAIDNSYFEHTIAELPADKAVPIGRPFGGNRLYLLDRHGRPAPSGVFAELWIGGSTLARGYLKQPAMTADKFRPDPMSRVPGKRLYRTGDLARYLADGNLEFFGRVDQQVKIRGFRIEIGEIEAEMASHPEVGAVALVVREDSPGEKRLIGYAVPAPGAELTPASLRQYLKETLPDYMVPAPLILLDAMPLSPNGKVDHRALPAPEISQLAAEDGFVAPETAAEKILAEIWCELLDLRRVGIHDNFFDLGGNSLSATQLISRVRTRFQVELTLASFFQGPTIAEVVTTVEVARRVVADSERRRIAAADEEREEGAL